ncbi:MAG: ferritin family protein [Syntrophaceticus sp.]|nr:ferritin family protein [Syntrophaceticus sp.]
MKMAWGISMFSGEEIVEIALQIEKSGKEFYEKALDYAESDKVKEALVYLAKEEEEHTKTFSEIGKELKGNFKPNEQYVGEYGDYVKSLVNSHIFNVSKVEDLVKEIKNDKDILRFALSFEKDSIVIFQEFKNAANKQGAELLEKLINEEKGHIKKINELFG